MTTGTSQDHTVSILTGYWFEALCHHDAYDEPPELLDRTMLDTPEAAIRLIRLQIRTAHPFTLSPTEVDRALAWADGGGRIHALAALHRGETAGFSIVLRNGLRPEWRVRPVTYLSLTRTHVTAYPQRGPQVADQPLPLKANPWHAYRRIRAVHVQRTTGDSGMDASVTWQKSSFSGGNGENCIEVGHNRGHIMLRESESPDTIVTTTPAKLAAFIHGVKAGEFDHLIP
ncbi:DUF397 domain-containing protein [Streptomyces sp. NPDC005180]|uniref:DUF397 domain-containing protein n=1 Tax=Streptomyces sp. NPDC005180 TaxID=3156868 RepID=UPI0033A45930